MRKIGLFLATAVAATSTAGIAYAIEVDSGLKVKTTGSKGTKAKPKPISTLSVRVLVNAKDRSKDGTFGSKSVVVFFDKGLRFNNAKFPNCSFATVAADTSKCPKGSLVGKGSAKAVAGEGQAVKVNPAVEAYNDKGGKLHLKLIAKPGEFDSQSILTGTLKKATGKFGFKLDVPIPAKLQNNLGLFVTIQDFQTTIKAKNAKGQSYVESIGCTGGKYQFATKSVYTDNSKGSATATSKC